MPLLSSIERKATSVKIGVTLMYLLLILGGITMIYPFLVTLSGAVSNEFDYNRYNEKSYSGRFAVGLDFSRRFWSGFD